jgi:hypothetical protein
VLPNEVSWRAVLVAVYPLSFLALLSLVLLTGITHRPFRRSVWIITLIWCAAFTWYAWLSGGSPFVHRELHTFDPIKAEAEVRGYYSITIPIFAVLTLWFLSFPVVNQFELFQRYDGRFRGETRTV